MKYNHTIEIKRQNENQLYIFVFPLCGYVYMQLISDGRRTFLPLKSIDFLQFVFNVYGTCMIGVDTQYGKRTCVN